MWIEQLTPLQAFFAGVIVGIVLMLFLGGLAFRRVRRPRNPYAIRPY